LTTEKSFTGKYLLGALSEECEKFDLDLALVADALGGDGDAIQAVAELLARHKRDREWQEKKGETAIVRRGLGMPDSLINELALRMLEALADTCDQTGAHELAQLFRMQLAAAGLPTVEVKNRDAMVLAALLLAENPEISLRKIAPHIGVNASTVSRWRLRADFRALIASVGTVKNSHVLLRRRPTRFPKRGVARGDAIKK
jgi:hypothetical protein